MKNRPICLIDMDLTIANTYTHLVKNLNLKYKLNLDENNPVQYFGDHTIKHPKIERDMIDEIFSTDEFFLNLPVIKGAQEAVERISEHFEAHIITRPWLKAEHPFMDKYNWLREYFPYLANTIHATSEKQIVYGDILIDDHMPFCKTWKEFWKMKNFSPITASLKYPWTDENLVDIVGKTWKELADRIIGGTK